MLSLTNILLAEGKTQHVSRVPTLEYVPSVDGKCRVVSSDPLELTITNQGDKVLLLEGALSLAVEIPCARCLSDVQVTLPLVFHEEVDMKLTDQERVDALDERSFIHGYQLDVDKLVCGEALQNWPSKVLCSDACKGLCRVCGQNLNLKTCDCDSADLDPRMAKIRDLFRLANQT